MSALPITHSPKLGATVAPEADKYAKQYGFAAAFV